MKTLLIVAMSTLYSMPAFAQDAGKEVQYRRRAQKSISKVSMFKVSSSSPPANCRARPPQGKLQTSSSS